MGRSEQLHNPMYFRKQERLVELRVALGMMKTSSRIPDFAFHAGPNVTDLLLNLTMTPLNRAKMLLDVVPLQEAS